jgi:tetratricopeptide (TPR) repeat protein
VSDLLPDNSSQLPADLPDQGAQPPETAPESVPPSNADDGGESNLDALIERLQHRDSAAGGGVDASQAPPAANAGLDASHSSEMDEILASIAGEQDEQSIEVAADAPRAAAPITPSVDEFTPEESPELELAPSGPPGSGAAAAGLDDLDTLIARVDDSLRDNEESRGSNLEAEPAPPPAQEEHGEGGDMDAVIAALTGGGAGTDGDVGSENLAAAGAVQEREGTDATAQEAIRALLNKPPETPAPPSTSQAAAVSAPPPSEAPALPSAEPPEPIRPPRRAGLPLALLAKAGFSLAVGLLFGLATYVFLSSYTSRVPELEVPSVTRTRDLESVLEQAKAAFATGSYAAAARLLETPLRAAPPSPLRIEAELLRLEAAYRALSPHAPEFEIEIVNSYMDTFLAHTPSHARASDVLQWKAALYERAGVRFAAYTVYADLLAGNPELPNRPELLLRAGRLALDTGRYAEASAHLKQLVKTYPGAGEAADGTLLLGEALVHLGKQAEGEALLTRVAQTNAQNRLGAGACTALGRIALERGDYQTAITLLQTRLQSGTTSVGNDEVLLMLAQAFRAAHQIQDAQDALRDIIRFFPGSASAPQAYLELTEALDMAGRRDNALRIASEAAQRYPGNPAILLRYAQLRELTGDARGAAQVLLTAEQAGASDPQVLLTAGRHFLKAGCADEAETAFERLASEFPGTPQSIAANVALAKFAFKRQESGRAMALLHDMAALAQGSPQETEVMLALGEMYQELGLLAQAADIYRGVASRASGAEVLAQAARALYRSGAWSEGNEVARRVDVEQLAPATAYCFLMEYGHAMRLADSGQALHLMEQAHTDFPGERTLEYTRQLVETCLALDRFDPALTIASEFFAAADGAGAEDSRELLIACGDYAMEHQDHAQAAACYSRILEKNAPDTRNVQWARFQLANALQGLGKLDEARPLLGVIAASTSPWAAEAQLKLEYLELRARMGIDGVSAVPNRAGGPAP